MTLELNDSVKGLINIYGSILALSVSLKLSGESSPKHDYSGVNILTEILYKLHKLSAHHAVMP